MKVLIPILLALLGCGCDALEPQWSDPRQVSEVNPFPGASCDDLCEMEGKLCLENSCADFEGWDATLAIYEGVLSEEPNAYATITCELPLSEELFPEPGWNLVVSCCCGSN